MISLLERSSLLVSLGCPESRISSIEAYVNMLWAANDELNLISRKMTVQELIDNHVIDCLLPLARFPSARVKRVADFGSGGGLPGVLYALIFPQIEFHLFEKSPKKRDFLTSCRGLGGNLTVNGEIPKKLSGVDLVIARAFKPIDVILEMSLDHCKRSGTYFLLKGRQEKIEAELALAKRKVPALNTVVTSLTSPLLEVERHLVEINPFR